MRTSIPLIDRCPGTLAPGFPTYSTTCLRRMFNGRKVSHLLPYRSPFSSDLAAFNENRALLSVAGVQEKFTVVMEKNKLRLAREGERSSYILKPIPGAGKNPDQMPANEHLTMQIARQVFGIETAENALIFFQDGEPAYLTKRFDIRDDGTKWGQTDFAALAGKTPQTHGRHYKYSGNYLDLFSLLQKYVPAWRVEAPKLYRLLIFNWLFSNGDAHLKNFSIIETPLGDYRLSPAYDLLNSRMHVADADFALEEGLLPLRLSTGTIRDKFRLLAHHASIGEKQAEDALELMCSGSKQITTLIANSFLDERMKGNYLQRWQGRLKKLSR